MRSALYPIGNLSGTGGGVWFVPSSFRAILGADPYISWGLDQPVFSKHDFVCRAVEEPVVYAVECTMADVVVEVLACIEVGASAVLSMKIPGWLTFPPRPGGLSPLHEARGPLVRVDLFSMFERVFACVSSS